MQYTPRTPERKFALVLVHGTWGRGFFPKSPSSSKMRRWFEKDSTFYSEIIPALGSFPFSIEAFSEAAGDQGLFINFPLTAIEEIATIDRHDCGERWVGLGHPAQCSGMAVDISGGGLNRDQPDRTFG
jgi:hypothetical protein